MSTNYIHGCFTKDFNSLLACTQQQLYAAGAMSEYFEKRADEVLQVITGSSDSRAASGSLSPYIFPDGTLGFFDISQFARKFGATSANVLDDYITVFKNETQTISERVSIDAVSSYLTSKYADDTSWAVFYKELSLANPNEQFDVTRVIDTLSLSLDPKFVSSTVKNLLKCYNGLRPVDAFTLSLSNCEAVTQDPGSLVISYSNYSSDSMNIAWDAIDGIVADVTSGIEEAFKGINLKNFGEKISNGFHVLFENITRLVYGAEINLDFTFNTNTNNPSLDLPFRIGKWDTTMQFINDMKTFHQFVYSGVITMKSVWGISSSNASIALPSPYRLVIPTGSTSEEFATFVLKKLSETGIIEMMLGGVLIRIVRNSSDEVYILCYTSLSGMAYRKTYSTTNDNTIPVADDANGGFMLRSGASLLTSGDVSNKSILRECFKGYNVGSLAYFPIWDDNFGPTNTQAYTDAVVLIEAVETVLGFSYAQFTTWLGENDSVSLSDFVKLFIPDVTNLTQATTSAANSAGILRRIAFLVLMLAHGRYSVRGVNYSYRVNQDTTEVVTSDNMLYVNSDGSIVSMEIESNAGDFFPYYTFTNGECMIHAQSNEERRTEFRSLFIKLFIATAVMAATIKVMGYKKKIKQKQFLLSGEVDRLRLAAANGDAAAAKQGLKVERKLKRVNKIASILGVQTVEQALDTSNEGTENTGALIYEVITGSSL